MEEPRFRYVGTELDLFAAARNWRAYWSGMIRPLVQGRVLEVGAGIGSTWRALRDPAGQQWVALEPDATLCARLRDAAAALDDPGIEIRQATTAALAPDERFDTVLYIDVLEHIEADAEEIARVATHVAPGGRIIVLGPAHPWLFTAFDAAIGHCRRYDLGMLAALRPPGFRTGMARYLDAAGLLASAGNRLLLRAAQPGPGQIAFWDGWLVPVSRRLDGVLGHRLGKSVLVAWQRDDGADARAVAA